MKTAVIDVGGGMRGIYGAGALDRLIDTDVTFDHCIGISAGSANVISYMAGQLRRNLEFYLTYSLRKEYMSFRNLIFKHSYLDLDYIYGTLSNSDGEDPLDYEAFAQNPAEITVIATDAESGKAKYFGRNDIKKDDYSAIKASCAIPVVCKAQEIGGRYYFDGALSDPIPVDYALSLGCERIVLILTKPRDTIRTNKREKKLAPFVRRKYPLTAEALINRADKYNAGILRAKQLEAEGKVLIVAPDDITGLNTLRRDPDVLIELYNKGHRTGDAIKDFLRS